MTLISSIFVGIAIIGCLYRRYGLKGSLVAVGCLALLLVVVGGIWEVSSLCNQHIAEKAKQEEMQRSQEAEKARIAEEKRVREAQIAEEKRIKEENKRIQKEKEEKIRSFALKNAPKVWTVYQSLKGEIDVQQDKIDELRKTLVSFDKDPDQDMDYQRICALRDDMIYSLKTLRAKLDDAYISARKYEASPSRKDYQELYKRALEDGILEADSAEAKFKKMRLNK